MFKLLEATINTPQLELTYLILASIGIIIVLVCIGAYLFGYGVNLRDRVQEINAFGAQLRISVITVFILIGVALIIPMVWKQFNNTVESLSEAQEILQKEKEVLKEERDKSKRELELFTKGQFKQQVLLLQLEGVNNNEILKKEDFSVTSLKYGDTQPQTLDFEIASGRPNRIKVIFSNINDNTTYALLQITRISDTKLWTLDDLTPTIPIITIKKDVQ